MTTTVSPIINRFQQLTSARVATTANLNANYANGINGNGARLTNAGALAALAIDTVNLVNNDRIVVANQTNGFENGIYIVIEAGSSAVAWILERAQDFQSIEQIKAGYFCPIEAGSANIGDMYVIVEPIPGVLGVNDINFVSSAVSGLGTMAFQDANAVAITGGTAALTTLTLANAGLHILDTNASHDLVIVPGSDLTADRNFTIVTGDAARQLTMNADAVLNQDVSTAGDPAFASVTVANTGLHILDTNASHDLIVAPGTDLTADRTLTLSTGDADRALDISAADVTISTFGASVVDDANAAAGRATLGAQEEANIIAATTADIGGGGAGPISVAVAGLTTASVVVATIESSSNAVQVQTVTATATGFDIVFSGDPGAACLVNFVAFVVAQ